MSIPHERALVQPGPCVPLPLEVPVQHRAPLPPGTTLEYSELTSSPLDHPLSSAASASGHASSFLFLQGAGATLTRATMQKR